MNINEKIVAYGAQEERVCHTPQGQVGKQQVGKKAEGAGKTG